MAKTIITPWYQAGHIQTEKDRVAYLATASCDRDPDFLAAALGDIARTLGDRCAVSRFPIDKVSPSRQQVRLDPLASCGPSEPELSAFNNKL